MAKFTKTIALYEEDTNGVCNLDKIRTGEIVIQRGQWVNICGVGHPPSRWVGISPGGSVWAVHYQGGRRENGKCRQRSQFLGQAGLARKQWVGSDSERYIARGDF